MTAEALKTINRPMKTSRTVTPKSHLSTPTRFAIRPLLVCTSHHGLLEDSSPLFVVFKLVEAGAGRRQQHHIAGYRLAGRLVDRRLERAGANDPGDSGDLAFDLFRRRADGVNRLDPRPQQSIQLGVVGVLVFAAQDQVDISRKRGDRLGRGVDIGGLGIVVVVDAVNGGHELQPMLDRMERRDRARNDLGRYIRHAGRANRGQHILDIVLALERNLGQGKHRDRRGLLRCAKHHHAVHEESAAADDLAAAEPENLRSRAAGRLLGNRIIAVEDQVVFRRSGWRRSSPSWRHSFRRCHGGPGGRE